MDSLIDANRRTKQVANDHEVWNLNLDQIESHSGRVLSKHFVNANEIGPSTYAFDKGTVLYSKLRPYLNKVVVADAPGMATTELVPLRCNEALVTPIYLGHFLRSPRFLSFATNVVAGAKMPRMVMGEFWRYPVPVPPLPDQRRIAAILDQAETLRTQRRTSLALLDTLTQSIFLDMFGDPVANERGWTLIKLGDLTLKMGSGATPTGGDAAYKLAGISLVRSMNVHDGGFKYKNLAYIDDQQAKKLANVQVLENDVLLNITGASVARVCRAPKNILPARVNQHVMIIRPKPSLNCIYLERLLLSESMKGALLQIGGAGATREAISKAQAEVLHVPVPPLPLQQTFATRIAAIEALKSTHRTALAQQGALFASLQHRAFSGTL
jgi:type I restriction enzyme, S subunit